MVCVSLLLCGSVYAAGIYRWVDQQGKVHFGDRPGGTAGAETIDLPSAPPSGTVDQQQLDRQRREDRQRLLDSYQQDREQKQQARRQRQVREQQRQERCSKARERLRRYQNAGGLYETLESGERRILTYAQRRAEVDAAREDVERWCNQ